MKREKKGSLSAALTILALAVISTVAEAQYLSFPFNIISPVVFISGYNSCCCCRSPCGVWSAIA